MTFDKLFNPSSVAVIGAAPEKARVGYALMKNLLAGKDRAVHAVTDKYEEVLGVRTVPSLARIEGPVDLAVIAVRADLVPGVVRECGAKGVPHAIVISAGFKEMGKEGSALEDELIRAAKESGVTILGPNCLGVLDTASPLNASFVVDAPLCGRISFLSQSGAIGTSLLDWARREGVGFAKFVSLGNEAGVTDIDMMEFLADDPDTTAVLMYLEKVSDGKRFMEVASRIAAKKPLVILRAGRSQRGSAAVMSHTGSLAPDDAVFETACRTSGAITVETLRDLFTFAKLLHLGITTPLQRLVVLTNGGGPSVNAADLIDLSTSLELASFTGDTAAALRAVLPPMAAVGNPIDVIGDATSKRYADALKIVAPLPDVDAILLIVTPQMMTDAVAIAEAISVFRVEKPIIPVFMGGDAVAEGVKVLQGKGLVSFDIPSDPILSLDELCRGKAKPPEAPAHHPAAAKALSRAMLSYDETVKLLSAYDIRLEGMLMKDGNEIPAAMESLGEGPYAMKAFSKDVVHKSDAGAVRVGVRTKEEIERAWGEMYASIQAKHPGALLDGMLLQKVAEGKEVIVGMKRDSAFGPVILVGLGGIFVEMLKDVSLRIAPVSVDEALRQLAELKGAKLLSGTRGEASVDLVAIASVVASVSRLAVENPEILEIDLNPVMASQKGAIVLDARLMVKG